MAHEYCDGSWIAVGGGGYDIWRVVPRAWSLLWMAMNDIPYSRRQLPKEWLIDGKESHLSHLFQHG